MNDVDKTQSVLEAIIADLEKAKGRASASDLPDLANLIDNALIEARERLRTGTKN